MAVLTWQNSFLEKYIRYPIILEVVDFRQSSFVLEVISKSPNFVKTLLKRDVMYRPNKLEGIESPVTSADTLCNDFLWFEYI